VNLFLTTVGGRRQFPYRKEDVWTVKCYVSVAGDGTPAVNIK